MVVLIGLFVLCMYLVVCLVVMCLNMIFSVGKL